MPHSQLIFSSKWGIWRCFVDLLTGLGQSFHVSICNDMIFKSIVLYKVNCIRHFIHTESIYLEYHPSCIHLMLKYRHIPVNWVIISPGNGLSPVRRQAITWTQCCFIVNWTPKNNFQWNSKWNSIIFIQENTFEIVVCQNGGLLV